MGDRASRDDAAKASNGIFIVIHIHSNLNSKLIGTKSLGGCAIRTEFEIARIRDAGEIVSAALKAARNACIPGATTAELDDAAASVIAAYGAEPLFLDHAGPCGDFPASTCISVEDEVVHGIPGLRELSAGEIVSIDCGVRFKDWCADAAITVPVGAIDSERQDLLDATESILALAIRMIRPGRRWSEIARELQAMTFDAGYGTVEEFCGHGIGKQLHEPPAVPCVLTKSLLGRGDFTLQAGMVIAIEPILAMDSPALRADDTAAGVPTYMGSDGWTVRTLMSEITSHFEHTVAVGAYGAEILTLSDPKATSTTRNARIPDHAKHSGSVV